MIEALGWIFLLAAIIVGWYFLGQWLGDVDGTPSGQGTALLLVFGYVFLLAAYLLAILVRLFIVFGP